MVFAFLLALSLVGLIAWLVGSHVAASTAAPVPRPHRDGTARPTTVPVAPARSEGADHRPAARPACPHAASQLLFAGPVGDSLVVDGVLVEPCGVCHPAGVPFHLRFRQPATPALSQVATSVLTDWAADGETVQVRIPEAGPARARLTDGSITIVLDLEESSLR
jgi:hypothetical protein